MSKSEITVHEALTAILAEMPGIPKGGTAAAAQGGYKYRGIEQITVALAPLLAKHGVVIAPRAKLLWVVPSPGMKDNWTDTALEVSWTITGPDGSTMEACTIGIGRDNADKGANKSMSQATKYLYLELFCIADTKDEAESADYSHDVAGTTRGTSAGAALSAGVPDTPGTKAYARLKEPMSQASKDQLKELALFHERTLTVPDLDADPDWLKAVLVVLDGAPRT